MSMKVDRYLKHVPDIEARIRELRPDAIVFGMGPTGWLLPWIDQRLLTGVRVWTTHDGMRIHPADDLILMDGPRDALNPMTDRYDWIVRSRPKNNIWVYPNAWKTWKDHLDPAVMGIAREQPFFVLSPHEHPQVVFKSVRLDRKMVERTKVDGKIVETKTDRMIPDTTAISPAGTTTLAWQQGCRRIGLLGVDMLENHGHSSWKAVQQVDGFFTACARLADLAGGAITNLSPITSLKYFAAWKRPSASSSAPTSGNATPEPSKSSNTPSASTQAVP